MFFNNEKLVIPENVLRLWEGAGAPLVIQSLYGREGSNVYDIVTRNDFSEVFEITRALSRLPGEILELASGSGRLTFPIAALNRKVTALDSSPEMLRILRNRAARLPECQRKNIEFVEASMSAFKIERSFGAIVLGTTSVTLLNASERQQLYRCVAEHLDEQGTFIVTVAQDDNHTLGNISETCVPFDDTRHAIFIVKYYPDNGFRDVFLAVVKNRSRYPESLFYSRVHLLAQSTLVEELTAVGFDVSFIEPIILKSPEFPLSVISARRPS